MKNDVVYIQHILEAINKVERYLKNVSCEKFSNTDMMIDAVVRELEIIGEAAKNVSVKYRIKHSQIAWNKMIGMRNFLIHEYFGVNIKIVWETCRTDLKKLKPLIEKLL